MRCRYCRDVLRAKGKDRFECPNCKQIFTRPKEKGQVKE
jgi:tRNA(Ile2) C34 agmatinyltransferase TiaS